MDENRWMWWFEGWREKSVLRDWIVVFIEELVGVYIILRYVYCLSLFGFEMGELYFGFWLDRVFKCRIFVNEVL